MKDRTAIRSRCILSLRLCASAGALLALCASGWTGTIDPNKPLPASLKPDILYFDFNEEDNAYQISKAEGGISASVEAGKVGSPPVSRPGPNPSLGTALEFNYGDNPPFDDANNDVMGNHLKMADEPWQRLMDQDFTMGAWIKVPEDLMLPDKPYKVLFSKGAFSPGYPGWKFQLSSGDKAAWHLLLQLIDEDGNQSSATTWAAIQGFAQGEWHHVAASFNRETQKITIWFDGAEVLSKESDATVGESSYPLIIGENGMSTYGNIPIIMDEVFVVSGVHDFLPARH